MFQCNGMLSDLFSSESVIAFAEASGVTLSPEVRQRITDHNPGGCVEPKTLEEPLMLAGIDGVSLVIEGSKKGKGFTVTVRFARNKCMLALRLCTFLVNDDFMFDLDRKAVQLSGSLQKDFDFRQWEPVGFSLGAAILFLLANARK